MFSKIVKTVLIIFNDSTWKIWVNMFNDIKDMWKEK